MEASCLQVGSERLEWERQRHWIPVDKAAAFVDCDTAAADTHYLPPFKGNNTREAALKVCILTATMLVVQKYHPSVRLEACNAYSGRIL